MHSILLLAYVPDFAGLFDLTNAMLEYQGDEPCDLRDTLQYKMLILCGTFVKVNKKTKTQVVWVEDTRSVLLSQDEKL